MVIKVSYALMLLQCIITTSSLYSLALEPLFDDPTILFDEEEVVASGVSCAPKAKLSFRKKNTISSRKTRIFDTVFIDMVMLYLDKTKEKILENVPGYTEFDGTESDSSESKKLSKREANKRSAYRARIRNKFIREHLLDQFKILPENEQDDINNIVGKIAQHEFEAYLKRQQAAEDQP